MHKLFINILSLLLISIGISFIIIYLNLLTIGYTFKEYVNFIISKIECISLLIGILLLIINNKKGK